jgi:hypothetical protein
LQRFFSRRNNRRGFVVLLSGLASARPARLLSIRNFSRFFSSIITHSHGSRSSMSDSLSKTMSSTPSMGKEDDRFAAAGNHAKPADFRSKVLAVGGVSGTYEELTGHKQELKVSMSVWVSRKLSRSAVPAPNFLSCICTDCYFRSTLCCLPLVRHATSSIHTTFSPWPGKPPTLARIQALLGLAVSICSCAVLFLGQETNSGALLTVRQHGAHDSD